MKHRLFYIPILFLFSLSFVDCAKKGSPSGGKRDSIPPVIIRSSPENYSTHFNEKEIKIYFDEYIKLKDLQKELLISPPLKYPPTITPLSTSKVLKIKILDTLKENTTYAINFGNSIVDNNEGNAFKYFKYVFSTGDYIDSLKISGNVRDALLNKPENPTTVMLFEVDENFKDSLIYSEKPTYITTTRDSTSTFEFTNLKEGNYLLYALKETNSDYIFQAKSDKIAFLKEHIQIPSDNSYGLTLFKEKPSYKVLRPSQIGKGHILFPYEGKADSLNVKLISKAPSEFESLQYFDAKQDTLHYWFKPVIEADSLVFVARNKVKADTLTVRIKNLFRDSLNLSSIGRAVLTPKDTVKLEAATPIFSVDSEKVSIVNSDTLSIESDLRFDPTNNLAYLLFPRTEEQKYKIELLPGAVTDFFEQTNDSLRLDMRTQTASDYGTLNLTLANTVKFPLIIQLVDKKYEVVSEKSIRENQEVFFDYINPGEYLVRIIFDDNANGEWDTGSFMDKRPPEKVIYYPSKIEMRANWSLNETFTLD